MVLYFVNFFAKAAGQKYFNVYIYDKTGLKLNIIL